MRRAALSLGLLLLLASACAGPPGQTPSRTRTPFRSVEVPAEENWWNNVLPLGAGRSDPTDAAIQEVHRYMDTVLALRRKARVDPVVWSIYDRVAKNLDSVDLKGLYRLIPADPESDGTKQLLFVGRREGDRYHVSLCDQKVARPTARGDFVSGGRFRPIKGAEDEFLLGLSMFFRLDFGRPTPDQVARLLKNMVRWYEQAATGAASDGAKAGIGPIDLAILRRFSGSFPDTYPWAMSLLYVDDLAWVEQRGDRQVTQVRIALRPNLAQFQLRYPKIYTYLVKSRTMRDSRFTLRDARGRKFAVISYVGEKLQVVIRAALLDGALIPLEGPLTDVSLDIERVGEQKLTGSMDLELRYWGVTVKMRDMRMPIRWVHDRKTIVGEYRLKELPREIDVSGRLLGVVPVWLVDLLIPGNLERMTRSFLEALIQGGGGKGMLLSFRYENDRPGHNIYSVRFDGELADNGFVQMQARLFKSRFAPRKRARGEIGDLLSNVARSLKRDLEAFRRLKTAHAAD